MLVPEPFSLLPYSLPLRLQDLPAESARICLAVEKTAFQILGYPLSHKSLLIALSGGADSLALLLVLRWLACKNSLTLHAVHVHHGLRQESDTEALQVNNTCRRLGIPLTTTKIDISHTAQSLHCGTEEAGRIMRYALFQELKIAFNMDYIVTGHQLNDLAEDSLMRLIRGTGWPALAGMQAFCPTRTLLRPLLFTSRVQIDTFLTQLGCFPILDQSNTDEQFFRNKVRHSILPHFTGYNPAYLDSVASLWHQSTLDSAYWQSKTHAYIQDITAENTHITIRLNHTLTKEHKALRNRVIMAALQQYPNIHVQTHYIESIDAFLHSTASKKLQLTSQITIERKKDCYILQYQQSVKNTY